MPPRPSASERRCGQQDAAAEVEQPAAVPENAKHRDAEQQPLGQSAQCTAAWPACPWLPSSAKLQKGPQIVYQGLHRPIDARFVDRLSKGGETHVRGQSRLGWRSITALQRAWILGWLQKPFQSSPGGNACWKCFTTKSLYEASAVFRDAVATASMNTDLSSGFHPDGTCTPMSPTSAATRDQSRRGTRVGDRPPCASRSRKRCQACAC